MLSMSHTVESIARERHMAPELLLEAAAEIGLTKESVDDTLSDWERERLLGTKTVEAFAEKLNIPPARLLAELGEIGVPKDSVHSWLDLDEQRQRELALPLRTLAEKLKVRPAQLLVEMGEMGLPKASVDAYISVDEQWQRTVAQPVDVLARSEDIPADSLLRKLEELGRPKPSAQALLTAEDQEHLSTFVRSHHLGSTIRAMRDYRGLTQARLAAVVGISDRQLAKIEAGEVDLGVVGASDRQRAKIGAGEVDLGAVGVSARQLDKIRSGEVDLYEDWRPEDPKGILSKLAEALQVEPRDFFVGKTATAAQVRHADAQRQDSVAVRALVTPQVRSAFTRIRDRYGWSITQVMELAPLMFVLLAESSLTHRRHRLKELRTTLVGGPGDALGHLRRFLAEFHSDIHAHLRREEDSINKRNLREDGLSRSGYSDPFSAYLFELADKLEKANVPTATRDSNDERLLLDWLLHDGAFDDGVLRCSACHEEIEPDHSHCPWCGERTKTGSQPRR